MKTVTEMAREAGYMRTVHGGAEVSMASMDCLERFAELVRADAIAKERESCAIVCEDMESGSPEEDNPAPWRIAEAIRSRSSEH